MLTGLSAKGKAALELAEVLGWPVFPCWWAEDGRCACGEAECSEGKHPLGKLVPNGLLNASADPAVIRRWWEACPEANVAVRTGESCWVLDLDGLDGIRAFNQRAQAYPDLPETPSVLTGGGGRHLYFSPDPRVKNGSKLAGAPIDVRGTGGYVLVPPSDHVKGCYRWERPATKYELEPAPGWVLDLVLGSTGNGKSAFTMGEDGDLATHPGAQKGRRNDTLCRLVGGYLKAQGVTEELFRLAEAWGGRCKPPLDEKQIRKTVMALAEKHSQQSVKPKGAVILQPYATIEPETVRWLWQNRIPLGKLVIVNGDPGLGKSYLLLDVASRVSSGRDFPDGTPSAQGGAIVVTSGDGAGDTVRPRLDLLGADVDHVFHLEGVRHGDGKVYPLLLDRRLSDADNQLLDDFLMYGPGGPREPVAWDRALEPLKDVAPCPKCASLLAWWDLWGIQHCWHCQPPIKSIKNLLRASERWIEADRRLRDDLVPMHGRQLSYQGRSFCWVSPGSENRGHVSD
jgi:hypothetical protein